MKKFIITLFILLILGGVVFFFGWAQFSVPPGAYGVISSKTHGIDPVPVQSGEFRWVWYKLIPTNVQILVFHLEPESTTINFSSSLPSGNSYASFAGLGADFSWEFKASVSFSLDPNMLIPLVTRHNINSQHDLDAWKHDLVQKIEVMVLGILASPETDSERLEKILSGSVDVEMEKEIRNNFPEICDFSFVVQSARFPDFVLYRQVRLLYEEFLIKQREYVANAMGRRAENHIEAQFHFGELERYGELLTKYPVLLQYLALEKSSKEE